MVSPYIYPNTIAPTKEKPIYKAKTLRFTNPQTADIAGSVVVGPAIRNANAVAGCIPWPINPPTSGMADKLLVYTGIPKRAAVIIAQGVFPPRVDVIQVLGIYR